MHPLSKVQPVNCRIVHAMIHASEIADVNGPLICRPVGIDFRGFPTTQGTYRTELERYVSS